MSRLLFAAARGARIQRYQSQRAEWHDADSFGAWSDKRGDRIHPDDAHLAYGPISTALREMAEDDAWRSTWEWFVANAAAREFASDCDAGSGDVDHPLFYLILAEALADEGL